MFKHLILAVQDGNQNSINKANLRSLACSIKNTFFATVHHLSMTFGLIAITILAIMFIKPELAEKFIYLSPFSVNEPATEENNPLPPSLAMLMATPEQIAQSAIAEESNIDQIKGDKMLSIERQQQWVTTWLAKRYRVANDASNMLVSAAYVTAKEIKLDPLLILSVMAIESGLNPFAESPVGAQGLMQVMSKVHHEKFEDMGGVKAALNPVANIKVGALILKDYVTRGGSVEAGLKMYVGAAAFDTDGGYGSRVMAEYARLKDVAAGKRVPIFATTPLIPVIARPKEVIPPPALETVTDSKGISNEKKLREQIAQL